MNKEKMLESYIKTLKESGFRVTKARKLVLELLISSEKPLTIKSIYILIKENKNDIDLASVYRILSLLHKENIVHKDFENDSYFLCEHLECETKHAHVFIKCTDCEQVREINFCGEMFSSLFKKLLNKLNSKPLSEHIYFKDVCSSCKSL